ncbi:MAG: DUF3857 domain-containing protein, partial [Calditrichia bacterium]|nr:DUF3857 domain-containing protein [Calditrichia bacterium]
MNYKNIKLLLIFTFLLLFQGLTAQTQSPDAIYKNVLIEYQLNEDGSTTYHYSHQLKLLTNHAFRRLYGETFIVYNPQYQKLTVNKSETTMADGTNINSPENAYNEVLPRFAANAPAYNHLREMIITHTGLEIGAEIDLDYQIDSKKGFLPGLMGEEVLANTSPITNATIRIKVPAVNTLYFELHNNNAQPSVKEEGNNKIYEWNFKNIPAVYPEQNCLAGGNFAPRLVFSTFKELDKAFASILSQPAFKPDNSKELKILVHKLKAESTSDLDFMIKLQKKVADEISTYHIPFAATGFKIRSPLEVWKSNGGTDFEKSILLSALLTLAEFPAEPMLISHFEPYSKTAAS